MMMKPQTRTHGQVAGSVMVERWRWSIACLPGVLLMCSLLLRA